MSFQYYNRDEKLIQQEWDKDQKAASNKDDAGADIPMHYLKEGRTLARIMPCFSDAGRWFREISEYTMEIEKGKWRSFTAPVAYGQPDPVAELAKKLREEGTETSLALAKELRVRPKFLFNSIILSDAGHEITAADGIRVLKAGVSVKRGILRFDADVQGGWGDITNPGTGRNVSIDRNGKGLSTEYIVTASPQQTDIVAELASQGININDFEMVDLDSLYPPRAYADLAEIVDQWKTFHGLVDPPQPVGPVPVEPVFAPLPTATPAGMPTTTGTAPTGAIPIPEIPLPPKGD